jgi:hypothetical protein
MLVGVLLDNENGLQKSRIVDSKKFFEIEWKLPCLRFSLNRIEDLADMRCLYSTLVEVGSSCMLWKIVIEFLIEPYLSFSPLVKTNQIVMWLDGSEVVGE